MNGLSGAILRASHPLDGAVVLPLWLQLSRS